MNTMRNAITTTAVTAALFGLMAASPANAAVTISSGPTKNMVCSGGVCSPTVKNTVLNVSQLESMLASGSVTVNAFPHDTSGVDIIIDHAITWASSGTLTLNAKGSPFNNGSITINNPISVSGSGGLALIINLTNNLYFGPRGHITFLSTASPFSINGLAYTLVNNIATLASGIAANPGGYFALANSYNATPDGTYTSSPIPTTFSGYFNGLGNTISHLTAKLMTSQTFGLFENFEGPGLISNVNLDKESITGSGAGTNAGGLIGTNLGGVERVTANVNMTNLGVAGGLVATNYAGGKFSDCYTSGKIDTGKTNAAQAGGVAGANPLPPGNSEGSIEYCYSTVSVTVGKNSYGGGLVGYQNGEIFYTYAMGAVTGGKGSYVGGLIGYAETSPVQVTGSSYSAGTVTAANGTAGGLVGFAGPNSNIIESYWDTTTSGISNPSQGAGTGDNEPGITGLSSAQLQSGLPSGLDGYVWEEIPSINGGLPYLLAVPPNSL